VKIGQILFLVGSCCLIIMVLAHVAEAFCIFPAMGWGLPNSVGHYLNLMTAILGGTLLLVGLLVVLLTRERGHR
jgi:hypothetical protein